ncbi:MAG: hypothetical protein WBG37_12595 [Desulfobacterales bacterium]
MRYNWLPWKFILRRLARGSGFVDPVALLAQFHRFAQPSEVAAPVELLRAGMVFHARGLINARTIQGNLDWVWPFWVQKQFDPRDKAFVPRSFALTQVNLTHRNWTAVGLPGHPQYPLVDPRGMVTPFFDGWSVDAWIIAPDGENLLPPISAAPRQRQIMEAGRLAVETRFTSQELELCSAVEVAADKDVALCRIRYAARSRSGGMLVVALRPFNPEGVSFVYQVALDKQRRAWRINDGALVRFAPSPAGHRVSEYRQGDVYADLLRRAEGFQKTCPIGMASAAALYPLAPEVEREVSLEIPLDRDPELRTLQSSGFAPESWQSALGGVCRLKIPDPRMQALYRAAVHTLVLCSPGEVYAGPFYYKRFWFRDAVFVLHALLSLGLHGRAQRTMQKFLSRQTLAGYFESQKGEWDSNGQVLWIFQRFRELSGKNLPSAWQQAALKGARWIQSKRLPVDSAKLEAGLLPAGFSAEHLGNNDFYYWDNFWAIAGLKSAAKLCTAGADPASARRFARGAEHLALCVERSLLRSRHIRLRDAVPASPYRRMDAGAIGSIIAGYPLKLWPRREPRLLNTLEYLLDNCFIENAFFQDMIHSGYNIYLTLHVAQCLLRAGDGRYFPLVEKAAQLASATGHWPEAVHPRTGGGCMGDGQHAWAAMEWIMMMHALFVAEEGDDLILLAGIPTQWLESGESLEIGPLHTRFGVLEVRLDPAARQGIEVHWAAQWRTPPNSIRIQLPGAQVVEVDYPGDPAGRLILSREDLGLHERGG